MYTYYDSNFKEDDGYRVRHDRQSKLMSKSRRKNYGTARPQDGIFDNF